MDLKNMLIALRNLFTNDNKEKNDDQKRITTIGCASYEYLKIIKKYQLKNEQNADVFYLFNLLYFCCITKLKLTGKNLYLFNDTFKKGNFPIPVDCQLCAFKDRIESINKEENIVIFLKLKEEDEKIIKYVCEKYGKLNRSDLKVVVENDVLFQSAEKWKEISLSDITLINEKEKNRLVKELKNIK